MSLPEFATGPFPSREDTINQIISSIAMEELGISHIINAEGEKLQYVLGTIPGLSGPGATIEDVLKVNESVRGVLQSATESQSLLRNKLQNVLASAVLSGPTGATGATGETGPATVTAGTVTRLDPDDMPTVVNARTGEEAVFNFGIPRGATGDVGPAGPTGSTGMAVLSAYGTFVSTTAQSVSGSNVAFNTVLNATPVGMELDTGAVSVTSTGTYRVNYRVSTATGTVLGAVVSLRNGTTDVPSSGITVRSEMSDISGVATVVLTAPGTFTIAVSPQTIALPEGNNAMLDIIRIA